MANTQPTRKSKPGLARLLTSQWTGLRALFNEYPRQFWVLVFSSFIDRLGGALLFPFFALYITKKFSVGLTEVGLIFAMFSITGLVSSLLGGALTDRMGRKGILIFGLVMSAISALLMGLMESFGLFLVVVGIVGLLADVGGPAQQAMVADLLPEHKRAQGYGIMRVVFNLAVVIGPMIGGLLAARSYLLLFIIDTVTSLITAGLVMAAIKETRKPRLESEPQESLGQTFKGYAHVLRDSAFTWFVLASMVSVVVYMQMNTTLAVYLRDSHGISEQFFGYILSLNAAMVVLFQFPITRLTSKYRPLMVMTAGTLFYAVGFSMYGYVATYPLFLLAMVVITIGEMLVSPVSQSIVASLAPEEMRGRYMATYGFSWVIPAAIGPLLAGLVIDNLDPRWVWLACGAIGLASAAAFYLLEHRVGSSRWAIIEERLGIMERLEKAEITAEQAGALLSQIQAGKWAKLTPKAKQASQDQVHILLSDPASGEVHKDLYVPIGLVNTIMHTDCRLSIELDEIVDPLKLRALISHSMAGSGATSLDTADHRRIEVSYKKPPEV